MLTHWHAEMPSPRHELRASIQAFKGMCLDELLKLQAPTFLARTLYALRLHCGTSSLCKSIEFVVIPKNTSCRKIQAGYMLL